MKESKVVALDGAIPIGAKIPYAPVVEVLEKILEAARSGEIQGLCAATLYHDGKSTYWHTSRGMCFSLVGAIEASKASILKDLLEI